MNDQSFEADVEIAEADIRRMREARGLSFRRARERFGLSYGQWRAARTGQSFLPRRSGPPGDPALEARILASVRSDPHWNTAERARRLGHSAKTVQRALARAGLSRLTPRLRHAGFAIHEPEPLAVARQRRVLALHPGALTHIDFKLFGLLRGSQGKASIRVCGCVVVDSLTGFAATLLGPEQTSAFALAAIDLYRSRAPFAVDGIVLSDNGGAFLADAWLEGLGRRGLLPRTTRIAHPWSNGKVEALNKTLKMQCFPAIAAGIHDSLDELQGLLDQWMAYYNERRVHGGHVNRGLPPAVLAERWRAAPGEGLDRLLAMGIVKERELQHVRAPAGTAHGHFVTIDRTPPQPAPAGFLPADRAKQRLRSNVALAR